MDIKVLGIDLGKSVCSLAGLDEAGAVVFRKLLQRDRLLGSATDACSFCCVARASLRASTASTGFTARKGWRCATAGQGARPAARVPRSWSRRGPMPAGLWISFTTSSPAGDGFVS